jgi:hypothetical protein
VPFTALQGIGRADVTAKLQLLQLPFYALAVWYLIEALGVTGVAVAWALRALCEAVLFFTVAGKLLPAPVEENGRNFFSISAVTTFLLLFLGVGLALHDTLIPKVALTLALLGLFILFEWLLLLGPVDRKVFIGGARSIMKVTR